LMIIYHAYGLTHESHAGYKRTYQLKFQGFILAHLFQGLLNGCSFFRCCLDFGGAEVVHVQRVVVFVQQQRHQGFVLQRAFAFLVILNTTKECLVKTCVDDAMPPKCFLRNFRKLAVPPFNCYTRIPAEHAVGPWTTHFLRPRGTFLFKSTYNRAQSSLTNYLILFWKHWTFRRLLIHRG
jgi:hypothetical protein